MIDKVMSNGLSKGTWALEPNSNLPKEGKISVQSQIATYIYHTPSVVQLLGYNHNIIMKCA